nr:putative transmembrane protein (PGPGW) [uncultured bacterium]
MAHISFAGRRIRLPNHPVLRIVLGCVLVLGGVLGFLPFLGFWMIPLGLVILSVDVPFARRMKRRAAVRLGRWLKPRWPGVARMLGFSAAAHGN